MNRVSSLAGTRSRAFKTRTSMAKVGMVTPSSYDKLHHCGSTHRIKLPRQAPICGWVCLGAVSALSQCLSSMPDSHSTATVGKPKFYSSHACGKSNSTAGAFPASRAKTSPTFLVTEVGRSGSAILTADMPFRISDSEAVIIAADEANIQRQSSSDGTGTSIRSNRNRRARC